MGSLNPNPEVVLEILRHSTQGFDSQAFTPYWDYQRYRPSQARVWEVQEEPLPLKFSKCSVQIRVCVPTEAQDGGSSDGRRLRATMKLLESF